MKSSIREELIEHNAEELFEIVLDIENYPNFIPWCKEMNVHSKTEKEIFADMIVWYKLFLPQTFGSHVVYDRKKLNINTTYIKGPLKDLKTEWLFYPLKKKQTLINFKVDFEFTGFLHQKIAATFYPLIENKMIESFKKRANQILN